MLCDIYLSQTYGLWGEDRLEKSEQLQVYRTRSFDLRPGVWHVRTDNCRGEMVFTRHELRVRGHVVLQARPVKASIRRKRGRRIAHGVQRRLAF
jgi:hypothetical protein